LKAPEFTKWLEGESKTLFCPGIPGAGKTMIASIVVDHLIKTFRHCNASLDHKAGVAYIYCGYGRQNEEGLDNLLASLLAQLLLEQVSIPRAIQELYDNRRRTRPSLDKISEELCSVISNYSRVFIVIDALDECSEDSIRGALLSNIFKLQVLSDTRLMATFRPNIKPKFPSSLETLEVRAYEKDIERYLNSRMSRLPMVVRTNEGLQHTIKTRISALVDGM
jgi:Cdc6-like AAA superfamily ATPase